MELQQAIINRIPIIALAKNNSNISGLIKGSIGHDILFYNNIDDILAKIIDFCHKNDN